MSEFDVADSPFEMGGWRVFPDRLLVIHPTGEQLRIKQRSMAVLMALVQARGQVVRKGDLMNTVWPRVDVTEGVLSQAILELRTAFDDDPRAPEFIETIRGVGFRLIPVVESRRDDGVVVPHPSATSTTRRPHVDGRKRFWIASAVSVAVAAACLTVWLVLQEAPEPADPAKPRFLLIAPFAGSDAGGADDYFARGFADGIAARLSSSAALRIFSNQAQRFLAAEGKTPFEIANEWDVDVVLTGTIRRDAGDVAVIAELADPRTGQQLWTNSYRREAGRLFDVQDGIARAVAKTLIGSEALPAAGSRVTDLTAFDLYLRGRELASTHQFQSTQQAIALFREALDLDPRFATARAALAELLGMRGYVFERGHADVELALEEAERALEEDPRLPEAHYAKAQALVALSRFAAAEVAIRRAVELSPSYSDALFLSAYIAESRGDLSTAFAHYRRMLMVDPMQPRTVAFARLIYLAGDERRALTVGERGAKLAPGVPTLYFAFLNTLMGHHDDAAALCADALATRAPRSLNLCGFAALVRGDTARAERLLAMDWKRHPHARSGPFAFAPGVLHLAVIARQAGDSVTADSYLAECEKVLRAELARGNDYWSVPYDLGAVAAMRGHSERAINWLNRAYTRGMRYHRLLETDPAYARLHGDPAFRDLVRQMKREFERLPALARIDSPKPPTVDGSGRATSTS